MKNSFIQDKATRQRTFNRRKQGVVKKLTELVTLCDVKACAVIRSPDNPVPEVWPSREGVEEVVSKFMEVSMKDRAKNMVDQEAFLCEMIAKEEAELQKLRDENRNLEIREIMFGCLEGKTDVHKLGEKDIQDLKSFIDKYIDQLNCRMKTLMENGESSSSSSTFVPSMNASHHQPETDGLATTAADACAPNITNNLESQGSSSE